LCQSHLPIRVKFGMPASTLMHQISSRSVYSVAVKQQKPPNFAFFWTSAFCGVANWWRTEKAEWGCTITKLPLSNGNKIISVLQRLQSEIVHTNSVVQKFTRVTSQGDGQSHKQKNKKAVLSQRCPRDAQSDNTHMV